MAPIGAAIHQSLEEGAALVFAEDLAHRAADLADRGVGGEGGADRAEEVAVAAGDVAEGIELGLDLGLIAVLLEGLEAGELALLGLGVDLEDVDVVDLVGDELVDADDDVLAALVALVVAERRLLDLALHELKRLDRAAHLFDLLHQLPA